MNGLYSFIIHHSSFIVRNTVVHRIDGPIEEARRYHLRAGCAQAASETVFVTPSVRMPARLTRFNSGWRVFDYQTLISEHRK